MQHKNNVAKHFLKFPILKFFCQKTPFYKGKEILKLIASSCETNKYTSLSTLGVNGFSTSLTISIIYSLTSIALKHILFLLILGDFCLHYFYTNIPVDITCFKCARLETLPSLVLIIAGLILLCSNSPHNNFPSNVINK